jgi:hypothetical protein
MDKRLTERVRELQCEVVQIAAAHREEMNSLTDWKKP